MSKDLSVTSDNNFFVEMLQWISLISKTGILTVVSDENIIKLYFRKGNLVSVYCEDPLRFFGQYLIKEGIIDERTLMKSLEIQEKEGNKKKIGEIISRLKGIDQKEVYSLLESMYRELLFDIFLWSDMKCYFSEVNFKEYKGFELHIDINDLIVEGLKRLKLQDEMKQYIKDKNVVFKRVKDKRDNFNEMSKLERKIFDLLKIPSSIRELMRATRSSEFEVSLALYNLLRKGMASIVEGGEMVENLYEKKKDEMKSKMRECIENLDFEGARKNLFELMHFIINGEEFNEVKDSIDDKELEYLKNKFDYNKTLKVKVDLKDLRYKGLSQMEAFLLSRINGGIDINSLIKLVPLKEVEVLKLLLSLKKKGLIE